MSKDKLKDGDGILLKIDEKDFVLLTKLNIVDDTATVSPTGIQQIQSVKATFNIVPNPSVQSALLYYNIACNSQLHLQITNTLGQEIWSQTFATQAGNESIALPANLLPGIYFVQLQIPGQAPQVLRWLRE